MPNGLYSRWVLVDSLPVAGLSSVARLSSMGEPSAGSSPQWTGCPQWAGFLQRVGYQGMGSSSWVGSQWECGYPEPCSRNSLSRAALESKYQPCSSFLVPPPGLLLSPQSQALLLLLQRPSGPPLHCCLRMCRGDPGAPVHQHVISPFLPRIGVHVTTMSSQSHPGKQLAFRI